MPNKNEPVNLDAIIRVINRDVRNCSAGPDESPPPGAMNDVLVAAGRALLFAIAVNMEFRRGREDGEDSTHVDDAPSQKLSEKLAEVAHLADFDLLRAARETIHRRCIRPCPPETDDIDEVLRIGYRFDGYERLGGFGPVGALANERLAEYKETGYWRGTAEELRCCLYFEHRRWHHFGDLPDGGDRDAIMLLFRALRERWDGDLPPIAKVFG